MEISRELFDKLCVFFARLDSDLTNGGDVYLSPSEVRDILLELSRKCFLRPEDVEKDYIEKYGTDLVRPNPPYFVHETEHTGKTKDTGLEYLKNVPNDWPPAPEIGSSSLTDLHQFQEDKEKKKIEDFMKFCENVKSRPQYKEGTLEAELKFWRDYHDNH